MKMDFKGNDGQGSKEWGVLANDFAIEGSAGGLHEGVAVRELDSNGHDGEKIHSLDGNLVEGVDREVALVPLVTV